MSKDMTNRWVIYSLRMTSFCSNRVLKRLTLLVLGLTISILIYFMTSAKHKYGNVNILQSAIRRSAEREKYNDLNTETYRNTRGKISNLDEARSINRARVTQTLTNTKHGIAERKTTVASTSDFSWKILSKNLSIYSSYYDKRYLKTNKGVFQNSMVIFGYELGKLQKLLCVVIMDDGKRILEKGPAARIMIAETWKKSVNKYRAFMYRCNLSTPGTPRYVTLINSNMNLEAVPFTSFIPVLNPQYPGVMHKFGVCYGSPLYKYKYDQEIMDSIEMNKLLGATWFIIYVYEAHDKAMRILRYYSQELKILDAVLNWGKNLPDPVFNKGQLIGLHDCVYRNMYRVRYLALCDLDELIMPMRSLNWHELFSKIDSPERAHFIFRHLGFHRNQSKPQEFLRCPDKNYLMYKMPRYFETYNRSVNVFDKKQLAKSITKPRYAITVHVHYHKTMLPGYLPYFVPPHETFS